MDWPNAVALVTGASSGIGYETALAFAQRGARVVGVARREDRLRELVSACNREHARTSFLAGDLGDRPFAEQIVAETLARHGRIDVLVNNAAMPKHKQIYDLAPDEAETVMRVNFPVRGVDHARGDPADARAGRRRDRERVVVRGADRAAARDDLRRVEGGAERLDRRTLERPARLGRARRDREPGCDRDRDLGQARRADRVQRPQAPAEDRGGRDPRVRGTALLRAHRAAPQLLAVRRAPDARHRARAAAPRHGGVRTGARRRTRAGARTQGRGKPAA